MVSTASYHPTAAAPGEAAGPGAEALLARYRAVADAPALRWAAHYRKIRLLGAGGQGVVYLGERRGADGFTLPVALKVFSPEPYRDADAYDEDMGRVAQVAARVARIQHDNLLRHPRLLRAGRHPRHGNGMAGRLRPARPPHAGDAGADARPRRPGALGVRATASSSPTGPAQPRFKPGVAIRVLRDCLVGAGGAAPARASSTATSSRPT